MVDYGILLASVYCGDEWVHDRDSHSSAGELDISSHSTEYSRIILLRSMGAHNDDYICAYWCAVVTLLYLSSSSDGASSSVCDDNTQKMNKR